MPFQQDLTGSIEPTATTWQDATPAQRLWYYQQVAKLAERKKRVELMQAIGRGPGGQSVVMDPRKHPRSDGANGPVMDPHGGASRAFQLLASSATANSCKLYWRAGGAIVSKSGTVYFTDVLGFHADGLVRGAPVRDVRLSDDSIAALRQEGESIWRKRPKQSGAKTPKSSATQPTKLSTKGPIQVGGKPFRTILPPKGTPAPRPAPARTEAAKGAKFAEAVHAAAGSLPAGKLFGGDKAFIHHAYGAFIARNGEIPYDEFKQLLLEAHAKGLVELSRADMVEAMSPTNVRLSTVNHPMGATFNFVRVPAPKKAR